MLFRGISTVHYLCEKTTYFGTSRFGARSKNSASYRDFLNTKLRLGLYSILIYPIIKCFTLLLPLGQCVQALHAQQLWVLKTKPNYICMKVLLRLLQPIIALKAAISVHYSCQSSKLIWGAATAAYQDKEDGCGPCMDRDTFRTIPRKILNRNTGKSAATSHHLSRKGVILLQKMGLNSYRSIQYVVVSHIAGWDD